MSADFNTFIEIKGSVEEVVRMLSVIKCDFSTKNEIHFLGCNINKKNKFFSSRSGEVALDSLSTEDVITYVTNAKGVIYAHISGPYGKFSSLEEVKLFEKMSEAAPNSYFKGYMSGSSYSENQYIDGELIDGKLVLSIIYPYEEYEEEFEDDYEDDYEDDCEIEVTSNEENDNRSAVEIKYDAVNFYDPINKIYIDNVDGDNDTIKTLGDYIEMLSNSKMSYYKKLDKAVIAVMEVLSYDSFLELSGLQKDDFCEDDYEQLLWNYDQFGGDYGAFCEFCGDSLTEDQYNSLINKIMALDYKQ